MADVSTIWLVGTGFWFAFAVMFYVDALLLPWERARAPFRARMILAAPVWPVVGLWLGGRYLGITIARVLQDATREGWESDEE